ncbi:MAG: TlyA family RNA methyltransferase [Patescibacteria group bacterium]|nr:TlyA family RNA methyltransferase [Patescibacteria group bacterium]MDE2116708.1 TlyA family RNA methyltransferase [Patescibacteria group bacterium]
MNKDSQPDGRERLDKAMHARGLVRSRSAAADLIQRDRVLVNGKRAAKASQEIGPGDAIAVSGDAAFVSRAGEKLARALDAFAVDPRGMTVLDVGSSTGGFVDCLLRRGAAKVIAVDVGTDQLNLSLRSDPRVEAHEGTDIRDFALADPVELATCDVSFISLEHILSALASLVKKDGRAIVLVKPQFEVGKETADRHRGVITDEAERRRALDRVKERATAAGFFVIAETDSPIEGEKGNREYLLLLKKRD